MISSLLVVLAVGVAAAPAPKAPPPGASGSMSVTKKPKATKAPEPTPEPVKAPEPVAAPTPVLVPEPPPPAPAPAKIKKVKLAANEWCHAGLDAIIVATVETRFYDLLGNGGVSVIAPKDVGAVLGIERQRQMMGCTEEATCLAEIGGALGADAVLYGCVVKAGSGMTVTLRAVSTRDAKPVVSYSERVPNEDVLQDWLDSRSKLMALKLRQDLGGEDLSAEVTAAGATVTKAAPEAPGGLRSKAWIPLAVGGAGLLVGALGYKMGEDAMVALKTDLTQNGGKTAQAIKGQGQTADAVMVGGLVAGAVGVAAGVAFLLMPSGAPVTPVAIVTPGGLVVSVGGSF